MVEREAIVRVRNPEEVTCLATPERVVGRKVLGWSPDCGEYEMGGPGFFGLRLESGKNYPEEWLILTLWAADNWLEVNGRWLAADPHQYESQRPLSNFAGDQKWDEFAPLVTGESLNRFEVSEKETLLEIGKAVIRLRDDPSTHPPYAMTGGPRVLRDDEDLRNAWIITQNPGIEV